MKNVPFQNRFIEEIIKIILVLKIFLKIWDYKFMLEMPDNGDRLLVNRAVFIFIRFWIESSWERAIESKELVYGYINKN